jgi:hypothetical protein
MDKMNVAASITLWPTLVVRLEYTSLPSRSSACELPRSAAHERLARLPFPASITGFSGYGLPVTVIWGSELGGQWRPLSPAAYPDEAALHDLVQDAPHMLPLSGSPELTVLGREVRLGAGYADLIAVESSGRLVIIEVKLAGNSESRRAVVAQILSYAGYLQGLDPDQLETRILASHLGTASSVLAAVEADDQQNALDRDAFCQALAMSLAEGSFRLVIVLDSAPDELVQVVGYLGLVASKIDIDLVTVTSYDVNGSRVLVPQRIEPARRTRELSDAQVTQRQAGTLSPGSAEFRASLADVPPPRLDLLLKMSDWADALEQEGLVKLSTYRGKGGIISLLPRLASDNAGLVTVYNDIKSAYLQFWRGVFERRAPRSIATVEAALGTELKHGNSTRTVTEDLITALTDAYREAVHG